MEDHATLWQSRPCTPTKPFHNLTKPFHNLLIAEVSYAGSVTMESGTVIRWCTSK